MLLTDLEHVFTQANLSPNLKRALVFLRDTDLGSLPVGRIEIDGQQVFALVQVYQTRPHGEQVTFEGHRKYIDVQFMLGGQECMGWAAADRFDQDYDADKDAWVQSAALADAVLLRVRDGELAIFYPEDAHAPGLADGAALPVKKVVVKAAV